MLSKEQANTLAQDLLDQAEAARIERLNAVVVPISWLWACPEFKLLAPHQRGDIVAQAKENVRTGSFLLFYCFIGLVWLHRVRREVRKLAAEMLPAWSTSDAASAR